MLVGVIKVPDDVSTEDLAKIEADIVGDIKLDAITKISDPSKNPLIWWQFVKLIVPIGKE